MFPYRETNISIRSLFEITVYLHLLDPAPLINLKSVKELWLTQRLVVLCLKVLRIVLLEYTVCICLL